MKNILIIGGAGFIGSSLVKRLIRDKNKITVIDDLSTGKIENIKYILNKIRFVQQDFFKCRINNTFDEVYLLAAEVNDRNMSSNVFELNVKSVNKAICFLKNSLKGKFYFTSSCTVYGKGRNLKESDELFPITVYGDSKAVGEEFIKRKIKNYFIFRIGNVFGYRQRGDGECGIIAIIKEKLEKNEKLKLYNEGKSWRDYVYVEDVINAMLLPKKPGIYNIGGDCYRTINLIKLSDVKYVLAGNKKESGDISLNVDKLKKLGWEPKGNVLRYIEASVK